jgi:hypothetical protein
MKLGVDYSSLLPLILPAERLLVPPGSHSPQKSSRPSRSLCWSKALPTVGECHYRAARCRPRLTPLVAVAALLISDDVRAASAADAVSASLAMLDTSADKDGYNLFNPTPVKLMRELNTDRPDKTESPYTVDAGHFQAEMDFVVLTLDREDDVRSRTWNVAPVNFKVGLLNNVDLQVIFDSYFDVRLQGHAVQRRETNSGVGDLTTRLKINLWGDDGGPTAFGLIPFLKAPTNTNGLGNDAVEGGVIFPLAVALPGKWDMGMETEVDFMRNAANTGYHPEFVNSITFGHDLIGKLGGYAEFFSDVSTERGAGWVGTLDAGLVYQLTENVQLDAGCNFGVARSADNLQPFTGLSIRF